MKKIIVIFLLAFVLNAIWENIHSFLYNNYMGGQVTEYILLRASLFDAILITMILLPFVYMSSLRNKSWMIIVIGTIVSILNEWYGLETGRWVYNELMPIIPIIKTGITPTLQLGILGYVTYKMSEYKSSHRSSSQK